LKNALGFLHLNSCPEGFGLTLIESMACETPVIGRNLGSIPEVIEDEKIGFVVKNLNETIEAAKKIVKIKRDFCRQKVEKHFPLERMNQ
jgi:glycosyltransferase involved in cell wall biosynthesis